LTTGIIIRVLLTFFERLVFLAKRRLFLSSSPFQRWQKMTFNATTYGIEARPIHTLDLPFPDLILSMLNTKIMIMWSVFLSPWPTHN